MKIVWALLILAAVAVGSVVVWNLEQRSSLRGGPGGADEATPGSEVASGALRPRNDNRGVAPTQRPEGSILAVFGNAPDFSLTERSGQAVSRSELEGRPWIADFIFTRCAGQCPLMSLQMRKLQGRLPEETGFRFVSFTVDPEWDTPEVLSEYADRYGAEKGRWFFLTGTKEEINSVMREFYLTPAEQPAMHSIRFILVDQKGQMRGYYDSSDEGSMKQLIHDAELVTRGQVYV